MIPARRSLNQGVLGQVKNAVAAGYPASQIIQQLHDLILKDGSLSNTDKGVVMEQLAIADDRLADGGAPLAPNAQKNEKKRGEMGEIWSKEREGGTPPPPLWWRFR